MPVAAWRRSRRKTAKKGAFGTRVTGVSTRRHALREGIRSTSLAGMGTRVRSWKVAILAARSSDDMAALREVGHSLYLSRHQSQHKHSRRCRGSRSIFL